MSWKGESMGVEGGTISAGGGGPVSGGGVGVSIGPAVGALGGEFGSSIGIGSTIVNEGPVASAFLENTMPLTLNNFKPLGEIIFNPFKGKESLPTPSVIGQAEEVAAAAWQTPQPPSVVEQAEMVAAKAWEVPLASQGETLEAKVVGYSQSRPRSVVTEVSMPDVIQAQKTKTALEAAGMVDLSKKVVSYLQPEVRQVYRQTLAVSTPSPQERLVEQIMEEKKIESRKEDKPQEKKSEKQSLTKIKIVEAVKITQLRRSAVFEAARKVKEEAEKTAEKVIITGKKLKKFLSAEFWKYISPLVGREGYDGTIPLTLNAIENNLTEYTNLEEAQTRLSQPVAEHIPLEKGEGGRVATVEEVREVLEGKEKDVLRSQTSADVVVRRVVSKNVEVVKSGQVVNTVVEEKEEVAVEPTLKSLGLEEVFPKAA